MTTTDAFLTGSLRFLDFYFQIKYTIDINNTILGDLDLIENNTKCTLKIDEDISVFTD